MYSFRELIIKTLQELNKTYKSFKGTVVSLKENYFDVYERYFNPIRDSVTSILELGVKQGASLKIWRDYFPNAKIFGIDNDVRCKAYSGESITIEILSQADTGAQIEFGKNYGPFDVIVDDASHINSLTLNSFNALFPYLKSGGWYIIEDLANSYEDLNKVLGKWHGELRRNKTEGTNLKNDRSQIDKFLLDKIKDMDKRIGEIRTIHIWSMLCFIQKV